MDTDKLPFEIFRLPRRRAVLGYLVSMSAYGLMMGLIFGGIAMADSDLIPGWLGMLSFVLTLLLAVITVPRLAAVGKKMRQKDALTVLAGDARDPVVYLRSFREDDVLDLSSRTGRVSAWSAEQSLCAALRKAGPVIAIGRPGERLPELGAARLYVDNSNWQKAVCYFFQEAAGVLIVVGASQGVWWEIDTALERVERRKLLFFFPFVEDEKTRRSIWHALTPRYRFLTSRVYAALARDREARYDDFRQRIDTRIGGLPERLGDAQFIRFDDTGRPALLETVRPAALDSLLQASLTNRKVGIHFKHTLRPYLAGLAAADGGPQPPG